MTDDVIPLNEIGKIGTVKVYNQAYVDKQQKRIEELEKENANVKETLEGYKKIAKWCDKCDKIADLEKKIKSLEGNKSLHEGILWNDLHKLEEELEKANEWHYVKNEGTPKVEGHYLVCLRNKDRDIFDCWIYYDKDVGWYSMKVRMKDIIAWKEIVLPELKEIE